MNPPPDSHNHTQTSDFLEKSEVWHSPFHGRGTNHFLPLLILLLGEACRPDSPTAPTATLPPVFALTPTTPGADSFYLSSGGGEPRSSGYWLLWNACSPENRAETARANGGRQAGWIILDDFLADPGILLGNLTVQTCQQGVNLLNGLDIEGIDRSSELAYQLAQSLLVAQLNLAIGAEYCPAVDEAVRLGQLLLISLEFDGAGETVRSPQPGQEQDAAALLVEQLRRYSLGELCR